MVDQCCGIDTTKLAPSTFASSQMSPPWFSYVHNQDCRGGAVFGKNPSQSAANGKELLSQIILRPFKVSEGDFENMGGRLSLFVPVCSGRRIF
jgi:hypothetical protein